MPFLDAYYRVSTQFSHGFHTMVFIQWTSNYNGVYYRLLTIYYTYRLRHSAIGKSIGKQRHNRLRLRNYDSRGSDNSHSQKQKFNKIKQIEKIIFIVNDRLNGTSLANLLSKILIIN
jgi:hypothetical protein